MRFAFQFNKQAKCLLFRLFTVLPILLAGPVAFAQSGTVSLLWAFNTQDGALPQADLVQGSDGSFYGTTTIGGDNNDGTVFKITPDGDLTTLFSFNGANGLNPSGQLVQAGDGNFYGTTQYGGADYVGAGGSNGSGTVFKITPGGVLTTLYSFSLAVGSAPVGGVAIGGDGNFYGVTENNSTFNGGTLFRLTPAGVLTTLYTFTGNDVSPVSPLVLGSDGNFYGTTHPLSLPGAGTLFSISPSGVFTSLVAFDGTNVGDVSSALVLGTDGNFYGVSPNTGARASGVVFKATSAGAVSVLYTFTGGADGAYPAGLTLGSDGDLYGTTTNAGDNGDGTIFKITNAGVLTILSSFTAATGSGSNGLVEGSDGNFYGSNYGRTANIADSVAYGSIFKMQPGAPAPTIFPPSGTYTSPQTVTMSFSTSAAAIYYTVDGSTPTAASAQYTAPITVSSNETLKAIAIPAGAPASAVASVSYTILPPTAATPAISPIGGTYTSVQAVTITDSTAGASIYYTVDGSTPTTSSAQYTGPITVSSNETLSAIAALSGYTNSAVVSAAYTIQLPAAAPVISPAGGTFTSSQSVTISDGTPGAIIYYTTDGSTPTTSSAQYTGAITVSSSETISAIATASGDTSSGVASASFTITAGSPAGSSGSSGGGGGAASPALLGMLAAAAALRRSRRGFGQTR